MNEYVDDLTTQYTPEVEFASLDLAMPNDKLLYQLDDSLTKSRTHWNQFPWRLEQTDKRAIEFLYPEMKDDSQVVGQRFNDDNFDDDLLYENMRSILSYATGQLGVPQVTPSDPSPQAKRIARNMGLAAYQEASDENVDQKVRAMLQAQISRKRSWLKLRLDPISGKLITDVCNPEDVIFDRFAPYMGNPNAIHHRIRHSIDEWISLYPKMRTQILALFGIVQGRTSQMSKVVPGYETWFSYMDAKTVRREGVAIWFYEPNRLLLDKTPNPNWIYTGSDTKDKAQNLLPAPPKPFIGINYMNSGKSAIDETCLFEQAIPSQITLNKRQAQWHKNIDYVNGRWVYDNSAMTEAEAMKIVNKGAKTLAGVNAAGNGVSKYFANIGAQALDNTVYMSIEDLRNRIKAKMGVNDQLNGNPNPKQATLGRDLMLKQQAGNLLDDLVRCVQTMYGNYYELRLHMMRVYETKNRTMMVKGANGEHQEINIGPDTLDPNVKIGVKADSTLPLDKAAIRQMSSTLLQGNKIDYGTAMEDLGYPDPEVRTEKYLRSQIDPFGYLASVTQGIAQDDARDDIDAVINGREVKERDVYDQKYFDAYNLFVTTNEFAKLQVPTKRAIMAHLALVQHIAMQQVNLITSALDDAGITEGPITPPIPKKTVQIRLAGALDPNDSEQLSGAQPPAQPPEVPATQNTPAVPQPPAAPPSH